MPRGPHQSWPRRDRFGADFGRIRAQVSRGRPDIDQFGPNLDQAMWIELEQILPKLAVTCRRINISALALKGSWPSRELVDAYSSCRF